MRRRQLGVELKTLREAAGKSRQDVVAHLGITESRYTHVENGRGKLEAAQLSDLLDFLGVKDEEIRRRLDKLRADARRRDSWFARYNAILPEGYKTVIAMETEATGILDFNSVIVPGLLQTPAFATTVMQAALPPLDPQTIDARLTVRRERQDRIFAQDRFVTLHFILDEACIARQVGGRDVWLGQLQHIADMSDRRNIVIQILQHRSGVYPTTLGGFTIFEFAQGGPHGCTELPTGDLFVDGDDVGVFMLHFNALRTAALPPTQTRSVIEELINTTQ